MTTYTITANDAFNSLEISFNEKPAENIREALKALKFRWHAVKKIWYGRADRETVEKALQGEQIAAETAPKAEKTNRQPEEINLDNLGENTPSLYGAELAAAIREDLKKRGAKGVTVRARRVTHDTGITVTITAQPEDLASVEEITLRESFARFACHVDRGFYNGSEWVYNFDSLTEEEQHAQYLKYITYKAQKAPEINRYHFERDEYPTITTAFFNKVRAVFLIANQWNYDNSDSMTDYFDIGYFLDIDIKLPKDYSPREKMTEEEKAAYNEELRQAEEKRAAEMAKWEKEQREAEAARKAYEEQRKKDRETIAAHITVEDLTEENKLYITGLVGGIGKECNLEELNESIKEHITAYQDALITRKVIFDSREAFEIFGKYLLDDFDFLAGKGGTASEDIRLNGISLYRLNEEQRESVKLYMAECVAVYVNNDLVLISNPEGYEYSRYTYRPTEATQILNAKAETDRQRTESESKTAFYFPEPITKQAEGIHAGQFITIYQCDGWMLNNIYSGAGEVLEVEQGSWAQYDGVNITLKLGKNVKKVFLRDNHNALVYDGLLPVLPDSITKRFITPKMYEVLNADELFPRVLEYYSAQGKKPIIDTIQR